MGISKLIFSFFGVFCYNNYSEEIIKDFEDAWNGTGWENIWKEFLESLSKLDLPESFSIIDTKSKYGRLDVSVSCVNDEIMDLIWELVHKSMFTCKRCGAQPHTNKSHIIWQAKGWTIKNLCRSCARKSCYEDREEDYKDTLLTGHKVGVVYKSINDIMNMQWKKDMTTIKLSYLMEQKGIHGGNKI